MGKDLTKTSAEITESDVEKRETNSRVLAEVMQYARAEPVHTDAELQKRISLYFQRCIQDGAKPTWEELVLALGVSKRTVNDWENGKNQKISPNTIARARDILATFDAKMVLDSKINPITYFFRAKNFYGMSDKQEVLVTPNLDKTLAPEDLINEAKALPNAE